MTRAEIRRLLQSGRQLQKSLFLPICKVEGVVTNDGTEALIVTGVCSVASVLDSQQDCMTEAALVEAMTEWSKYANVRMMHDPRAAVGTCKMPPVGKLAEGIEPPGWRMSTDPVTGAPCAILRIYVADAEAIAKIKAGTMRGLSVGGQVLEAVDGWADVDALGRVTNFEAA